MTMMIKASNSMSSDVEAQQGRPSLQARLTSLSIAARSQYLILQHSVVSTRRPSNDATTSPTFSPPGTPASVPTSPSVGCSSSMASYAVGANATIVSEGSLEEDGGLEGLRQQIKEGEVQYIFLKFRGEVVFVQYLADGLSAIQRARSMVIGRSLMSQMPTSTPPLITITHPRQLTDPLIRSKLGPRQRTRGVQESGNSVSSPFLDQSLYRRDAAERADVPISVSATTFSPHVARTISSRSMAAYSPTIASHQTHPTVGANHPSAPSYEQPKTPASIAVGLGFDNVGLNVFSPVRDLFGHDDTVGIPPPPPLSAQWSPSVVRSPSDATEFSPPSTSTPTLNSSVRSFDASPAGPLNAFPTPPFRTPSKPESIDSSVQASRLFDHAVMSSKARPDGEKPKRRKPKNLQLDNFSDHSIVVNSVLPSLPPKDMQHGPSVSPRRASFSSSAASSILYNGGSWDTPIDARSPDGDSVVPDRRRETLEQERLDFLEWRAEQEAIMAAKERARERVRRKADEEKREQVMRRLMKEQDLVLNKESVDGASFVDDSVRSTTRGTRSIASPTTTNYTGTSPSPQAATLPPSPIGQRSTPDSTQTTTKTHVQSKRSGEFLPLPPLLPPVQPLPAIPDFKRKSGGGGGGGKAGERSATSHSSAHSSSNATTVSSGGPSKRVVPMVKPLDERVQAAIEREMRRPVITLEGHVRPRVNRRRALSSAATAHSERQRKTSESFDRDRIEEGMNPLLLSMLKAKQLLESNKKVPSSVVAALVDDEEASEPLPLQTMTHSVRTLYPNGRSVGSGWALALAEEDRLAHDKDLPILPPTLGSVEQSDEVIHGPFNWQHVIDSLLGESPEEETNVGTAVATVTSTTNETPMTLIDQVFQQKVRSRSPSDEHKDVRSLSEMTNEEKIKALHARQDVLEAMLHALQRKRTLRSERERKARERWRGQSDVRASLTETEREQLEWEEQERREKTAREDAEEEKSVRIITLILLPSDDVEDDDGGQEMTATTTVNATSTV